MGNSEENCEWVRDRIAQRGLIDYISTRANAIFLARFAPQRIIDDMFHSIAYSEGTNEEAP